MLRRIKNKTAVVLAALFALSCLGAPAFCENAKPKNLKEAYTMMQDAYKNCTNAISNFNNGEINGTQLDEKLQTDIFYKNEYEKLQKKSENDGTSRNVNGTENTGGTTVSAQPAQSGDAVLDKKISDIVKYDPSIAEVPQKQGGRFWRKLFGRLSIDDYLYDGYTALQSGKTDEAAKAFEAALKKNPSNRTALYYLGVCKSKQGNVAEATQMLDKLYNKLKEDQWAKTFKNVTDPWVEAEVAFKIGGFDSLDEYKKKIAAGNRKELHSDEYYEKYVNKKTWDYYSKSAEREFNSIAGIDCGGFVQRVYMDLCKQNGIKAPFNSKLPGDELKNYASQIKDDGIIPPMTAKPGDFILLKEHDGWGHAFYFAGRDESGTPLIVEASGEGKVLARPMPDRYYQYYEGTYKFKDMDKIREKMSQPKS